MNVNNQQEFEDGVVIVKEPNKFRNEIQELMKHNAGIIREEADGGYAEYVLVPSYKYLLKMDDEMDTDASATLSCSALTAYGAVKNANPKPYDNVIIVGAGGLK